MFKVIVLTVACVEFIRGDQCEPSHTTSLKFSLKTERNSTGHWNSQIELRDPANPSQTGPWSVDMEHITDHCKDFDNVVIKANITVPPKKLNRKKVPAPGFEIITGLGYYKFHPEPKTWFEAYFICEQENSHLLIINSDREADAMNHFWTPHPKIGNYAIGDYRNNFAHIGVNDLKVEGEFVTIFGENLNTTGYMKWYPGDPDKGINENCIGLYRTNNLLGDIPCEERMSFFCEKEI